MQKILEKFLNNGLVILVILNLISYQVILPISISRADNDSGETKESVSDSSSSSSDSEEVDEDDEEETADVEEDEESEENNEEESAEEVVKEVSANRNATEKNIDNAEVEDTSVPEVVLSVASEISTNSAEVPVVIEEAISPIIQSGAIEHSNVCSCQETSDENDNEEEICPSDCVCCQTADCESTLMQVNVAEDVANTAEAVSQTGGNAISGEVLAAQVEPISPNASDENSEEENDNDDSDSGNDEDASPKNQAVIVTGDAVAATVAVNNINTNIYTENGTEYVKNITGDFVGDVNLIEAFDGVLDSAQKLNEENQKAFEKVTVTNVNVAEKVENTVLASASSGENLIEAMDGVAEIVTGGAEAVASAVNFVNTNIVGNNWLFAQINILGNWTGDLIVPGEGLFDLPSSGMIFDKVVNTNLAKNVSNFLSAQADTGGNSIDSGLGDATIISGDSSAASAGMNLVNTNITNNNWFYLLINNAGSWVGQVYNWNNGEKNLAYEYNFDNLEGVDSPVTKCVSVNNYNSAEDVNNIVLASAKTGGNVISEVEGDATIVTGDAVARASAFNFINTNIVGNNWFMAVVNNAGTWNGDLVFGYPDLAVNLSADKSTLEPGKNLIYTINYKNIGQAKCGNIDLMLSLPEYFIYQSDSLGSARKSGNDYFWSMPGLKAGEEKTFNVMVILDPTTTKNVVSLESVAGVKTGTQEINLADNYESEKTNLIFLTDSSVIIQNDAYALPKKQSKLSIAREEDSSALVGSVSTHSIFVKNSGKGSLYNIEVKEIIKNPAGEKLAEYIWPIAELKKGQTATIQYQIFVDPSMTLGDYELTASAKAVDYYGRKVEGEKVSKTVAFIGGVPTQAVTSSIDESSFSSSDPEASLTSEETNNAQEILGMTDAKKIAWQWFFTLFLIPLAYYVHREKGYRWETIQKFSRQIGSFLSTFL